MWQTRACFLLPWVIVHAVRGEIEDIWSQLFDCGDLSLTIIDRGQEDILLLLYCWARMLLGTSWKAIDRSSTLPLALIEHCIIAGPTLILGPRYLPSTSESSVN